MVNLMFKLIVGMFHIVSIKYKLLIKVQKMLEPERLRVLRSAY